MVQGTIPKETKILARVYSRSGLCLARDILDEYITKRSKLHFHENQQQKATLLVEFQSQIKPCWEVARKFQRQSATSLSASAPPHLRGYEEPIARG